MRGIWRGCLLLGGLLLAGAGAYYAAFGAVYYTTYMGLGASGECGTGCISSSFRTFSVTYSMYPIWAPPSWTRVEYNYASCAATEATHTPQHPPPSCLSPPAFSAPDYGRNYGGAAVAVFGAVMAASALLAGRAPAPRADAETGAG